MKLSLAWISVCLLSLSSLAAQNKNIIWEAGDSIQWAGVDRAGDLFLVIRTGEVQKINKEGKKIGSYSFKTPPTLLDPLDGVQSFYYLEQGNVYGNLSYDLSSISRHPLDAAFAISPWLVCPSLHELWILDSADFSIKKTKLNSSSISLEAALKHLPRKKISDYIYLREYQNYLFLLDKTAGVHLFNSLGKYIKTLGEKELTYFNFLGEEMYYLKGNEIHFVDLYTDEKRSMPVPVPCQFALLTDDRLYAVGADRVTISEFKPE